MNPQGSGSLILISSAQIHLRFTCFNAGVKCLIMDFFCSFKGTIKYFLYAQVPHLDRMGLNNPGVVNVTGIRREVYAFR